MVNADTILILQVRKLRRRDTKEPAQGPSISVRQGQHSKPGCLAPGLLLLTVLDNSICLGWKLDCFQINGDCKGWANRLIIIVKEAEQPR